ncbi:MAG: hypothetical protein MUP99_07065, partial [Pedobacter sp.]|nr:hypothetical protein [Pedobacter sp.]
FLGTELNYKFNTYKISTPTDQELLANTNPFAMVVLAARGAFRNKFLSDTLLRDKALSEFKFNLIRRLILLEIDIHRKKHILYFIINYIHFEFKETLDNFEKDLQILIGETNMGMVEQVVENKINRWKEDWRMEAIQEEKMEQAKILVRNLIRDSNFSDRDIAQLNNVSLKFVKSIREKG